MIEIRELRIGNCVRSYPKNDLIFTVKCLNDTFAEIEHIDKDGTIYNSSVDYENLIPIPLTEEILLKFGFEKATPTSETPIQNDNNTIFVLRDEDIKEYNIYISFGADTMICIGNYGGIRYIESVHQLQNLFYCLCGIDLELKN